MENFTACFKVLPPVFASN